MSRFIKKYKISDISYKADNEFLEHAINKNQNYLNLKNLIIHNKTKNNFFDYLTLIFKNIIRALYEIIFNIKLILFLSKDKKILDKNFKNCIFSQFAHLDLKNDYIPSYWSNFKYFLNFNKIIWCFMFVKSDQFKTLEDLKIYLAKAKNKNIIFLHSLGSISLIVNVIIIYFKILTIFLLVKKKDLFKFRNYNLYNLF